MISSLLEENIVFPSSFLRKTSHYFSGVTTLSIKFHPAEHCRGVRDSWSKTKRRQSTAGEESQGILPDHGVRYKKEIFKYKLDHLSYMHRLKVLKCLKEIINPVFFFFFVFCRKKRAGFWFCFFTFFCIRKDRNFNVHPLISIKIFLVKTKFIYNRMFQIRVSEITNGRKHKKPRIKKELK